VPLQTYQVPVQTYQLQTYQVQSANVQALAADSQALRDVLGRLLDQQSILGSIGKDLLAKLIEDRLGGGGSSLTKLEERVDALERQVRKLNAKVFPEENQDKMDLLKKLLEELLKGETSTESGKKPLIGAPFSAQEPLNKSAKKLINQRIDSFKDAKGNITGQQLDQLINELQGTVNELQAAIAEYKKLKENPG
jgi:hypothetical protein